MNTKTDLEKVLEKMGKLITRSIDPSSTANERLVASNALNKLSEKYNVSIESANPDKEDTIADISEHEMVINNSGRRESNKLMIAAAASSIFGAITLSRRLCIGASKKFIIVTVGTKQQRESSTYLYHFLLNAANEEAEKAYTKEEGNKRSFKYSFTIGFANSIYKRSEDIKKERGAGEVGLVLAKTLPEQYLETLKNLSTQDSFITARNSAAYLKGGKVGSNTNLGNSVNNISGALNEK